MDEITPSRIRATRLERGLTLREASEQVGVTLNTFARWERGERDPSRGPRLVVAALSAWLEDRG